jgi:hypothetical protein
MLQTKVVKEITTHFIFSKFFSGNRILHNVEKPGRARQATADNIIRRMHFAG